MGSALARPATVTHLTKNSTVPYEFMNSRFGMLTGPRGPTAQSSFTNTAFLILLSAYFLTTAFPRQSFLHAMLLTGLQIVRVSLHFLNHVLLLDFSFETAQSIFKRFALLQLDFGQ